MPGPIRISAELLVSSAPSQVWDALCHRNPLGIRGTAHLTWVVHRELAELRDLPTGPLQRRWVGVSLETAGHGTKITAFAELTPRPWWPRFVIKRWGHSLVARTLRCCRLTKIPATQPVSFRTRFRYPLLAWRFRTFVASPTAAPLVERLKKLLFSASPHEAGRLRPYALAEHWQEDPARVLRLFLHAAHAGLLQLQWELRCDQCHEPKAFLPSLSQIPDVFHCTDCGLDYAGEMGRHLELSFRVDPRWGRSRRTVPTGIATAAQPAVLVRKPLGPYEHVFLQLTVGKAPLRLRSLATQSVARLWPVPRIDSEATQVCLTLDRSGWMPKGYLFRQPQLRLEIRNVSGEETIARIETGMHDRHVLTATQAAIAPDFRTLFPHETPGRAVEAGYLCFVAIDLRETAELYDALLDREALQVLGKLEIAITRAILAEGGTVLRPLGDAAVLAAFALAATGAQAAIKVLAAVEAESQALTLPIPISTRVGIHAGPAIAFSRDGILQFGGQPALRAKAFLHEGQGGDIIFSPELLDHPGVRGVWAEKDISLFSFTAILVDTGRTTKLCRALPGRPRESVPIRTTPGGR